jgi:hypothetical protein
MSLSPASAEDHHHHQHQHRHHNQHPSSKLASSIAAANLLRVDISKKQNIIARAMRDT